MLRKPTAQQTAIEMVALETLAPQDHLLRRIDATIDFSFIHELVEDLYCPDNGRPALDPVVMFKSLFIGYLLDIRSERQLVREIEVDVAYRWYLLRLPAQCSPIMPIENSPVCECRPALGNGNRTPPDAAPAIEEAARWSS